MKELAGEVNLVITSFTGAVAPTVSYISGLFTGDPAISDSDQPPSRFVELPDYLDPSGIPGTFDDGDPTSTNLHVGNLSPEVDENVLLSKFRRFGPIVSVKRMWPRTEEELRRQGNCGFVVFMNRPDAYAAKKEMQGVVVSGHELNIGWGKSVSLPSEALPDPVILSSQNSELLSAISNPDSNSSMGHS